MDAYRAVVDKRDQRAFLPKPLPEESLRRILQAARMAGSSKNSEPNRLVVVRDRERLAALAGVGAFAKFLAQAAAVIVIAQTQRHEFDAGRCAQNMMVAAWNDGIGSCPAHLPEADVARLLGIPADEEGAQEIAGRSRGTPRIANRLLRRVRDFAQVSGDAAIDRDAARRGLGLLEVDEHGFDEVDRKILDTLIQHYDGGPAGIAALAAAVGEDRGTLEDLYEPYLIQEGFLQRTPRGRVATGRAYEHLGYPPRGATRSLF